MYPATARIIDIALRLALHGGLCGMVFLPLAFTLMPRIGDEGAVVFGIDLIVTLIAFGMVAYRTNNQPARLKTVALLLVVATTALTCGGIYLVLPPDATLMTILQFFALLGGVKLLVFAVPGPLLAHSLLLPLSFQTAQPPVAAPGLAELAAPYRDLGTDVPLARGFVVRELRGRGTELLRTNRYLLAGILTILISAAFFVVFAGNITTRDAGKADALSALQRAVASGEEQLPRFAARLSEAQAEMVRLKKVTGDPNVAEAARNNARMEIEKADAIMLLLQNQLADATVDLRKRKDLVLDAEKAALAEPAATADANSMAALIAAGVTRFGVLVIAIYLVQILVNLYRYNAQVAAHYFSQADTLMLLGEDHVLIGELASKLQLKVSFGKPEKPVVEHLATQLAALLKDRLPARNTTT